VTRILAWLSAAIVMCIVAGCADVHGASRRLNVGMTEQEVTTTVGYQPESVSVSTCGTNTPHTWQCKSYMYGGGMLGTLMILFAEGSDGVWRVNSWSTW